MSERTNVERINILEQNMESLRALPGRVEALGVQLVQLRSEMRGEFSAVRSELQEGLAGLRGELLAKIQATDDDLRAEMHALHRLTVEEIKAGDEETRRHMRVLFEELVTRIATIGEGGRPRRRR
jgi:hypothetical protein